MYKIFSIFSIFLVAHFYFYLMLYIICKFFFELGVIPFPLLITEIHCEQSLNRQESQTIQNRKEN